MSAFRIYEEKPTSPIHIMKWNPRIDLNAVALLNDEIWLHRLVDWQKVWSLSLVVRAQSTPKPKSKKRIDPLVSDIEWRPDGKVLAVAYAKDILNSVDAPSSKKHSCIALIEIESSEVIHVIELPDETITCLCWSTCVGEESGIPAEYSNTMLSDGLIQPLKGLARINSRQSTPSICMRKLTDQNLTDLMKVSGTEKLNLLAVGTRNGSLYLYALGLLPVRQVRVFDPEPGAVLQSVGLLEDMSGAVVVHQTCSGYEVTTFSLSDVQRNCQKILVVALIHAEILSFIRYMKDAISLMLEIWEDINLEIETKLSMYFKQNDGSDARTPSSDEFMELLVFGNASDSLGKFLRDMGEKGLKKLGHSIEVTYSSVQKIVVLNLQRVCYHLIFHLNHLKGLSLWTQEFDEVGINWPHVQAAIQSCGSFLMKVIEFQQVIDTSIRTVKAFFRWLFSVIFRLYGESGQTVSSATADTIKISQQDLQLVAEFIEENFESGPSGDESETGGLFSSGRKKSVGGSRGKRESIFTLDRVGQYLEEEKLVFPDLAQNCWIKFLNERSGFPFPLSLDSTPIFPHDRTRSLIQEHAALVRSLMHAFQQIQKEMTHQDSSSRSRLRSPTDPLSLSKDAAGRQSKSILVSHVTSASESCHYTVICPLTHLSTDQTTDPGTGFSSFGESVFILKYAVTDDGCLGEGAAAQVRFTEDPDTRSKDGKRLDEEDFLSILDLEFYDAESLFLLLADTSGNRFMAQVPIPMLIEGCKPLTNDLLESVETTNTIELSNGAGTGVVHFRKTHGVNWHTIAVSGARRVAAIASKRKIRIYETDMDYDEDDEDVDDDCATDIRHDLSQTSIAAGD